MEKQAISDELTSEIRRLQGRMVSLSLQRKSDLKPLVEQIAFAHEAIACLAHLTHDEDAARLWKYYQGGTLVLFTNTEYRGFFSFAREDARDLVDIPRWFTRLVLKAGGIHPQEVPAGVVALFQPPREGA